MTSPFLTEDQELRALLELFVSVGDHGLTDDEADKLLAEMNHLAMMAGVWSLWEQSATKVGVQLPDMKIAFKVSDHAATSSITPDSDSGSEHL